MLQVVKLDGYYSVVELCAKLDVHPSRITSLVLSGELPRPTKIKGCAFYAISDVEKMIKLRKLKSQARDAISAIRFDDLNDNEPFTIQIGDEVFKAE